MASVLSMKTVEKLQRPPTAGSTMNEPLRIPKTPLESRQGYHPKSDEQLRWRGPPTRQLTRQRRVEYESDIRERFYDDYIGQRTTGDAGNSVQTNLSKMRFHPDFYRANAYQGLIYDPMRPVPAGLNFTAALSTEREREKSQQRKRRLSDSFLMVDRPGSASRYDALPRLEPMQSYQQDTTGLPYLPPAQMQGPRPRSALQKSMDESLNPEIVEGVESWLTSATPKEKEVATNFLRTLSSQGSRPLDPASKAAVHKTRVRSAVMTPARKMREEQKMVQNEYRKLSRKVDYSDESDFQTVGQLQGATVAADTSYRRMRSRSKEGTTAKGSMFSANKQMPSHFTIHPDWASEHATSTKTQYKRKY